MATAADVSYEQHLKQNNERLVSLRKQLNDIRGYDRGCRELIAWCDDPRAFNAAFEENLLAALQEVVKVSSNDGFDRQLAIALITSCHSHRKLLSKESAARISRWNGELKRQKRSSSSSQAQQHRQQNSTRKAIARGSTATSLVITSQSQQSSSNAPATVKQSTHKRRLNTTLANRANNNKKKSAYNSNSNNNNNTNEDTSTQLQLTSTTTTFNNTNNTSYPVGINRTTGDCISNNINDINSDNHISHISECNTKLVYLNNNSTIVSRGGITEWNASINIIPAQEQPANLSSRVQATDGVMVSDLEQMMRMPNQLQQNRCQNYQNQNCQSMPRYLPSAISKNSDKLNNNPQLPVPPTSSTSGAVPFEGAIGVYETTCVSAANDGIRREVTLTTTEEGGSSSDTGGNWSTHPQLDLLPSSNQELMWSSGGGTAIAVGGASGAVNGGAIAQSSPSYGPVASDYANMAAMSVRSPMTGLQETSQVQQMNVNAMRYQHYMQGQVASPSFMGSATVSQQKQQQSAYPIDPTGARPGSFPSQNQANSMASMAQSPAYDQSCMTQGAACMPQSGYSIMHQQQQQMMMSQGSAMQMQYRSQQTYSTMQQMRMYGQQQQRAMLLHQQQQLANSAQSQPAAIYENGAMYPYGIPTATQRTPGMPGMSAMGTGTMCASTQMQRQMMIANGGGMMMMSPNGACMPPHQSYPPRVRNPPSVSPAYPQGTTAVPGYPQGQSMMIRAGPPMLYSQLQHEMTRQQVVAYSNPNAIMRPDPSDPNLRCMPSSQPSFPNEAKMAIPVEIVLRQFCLDHNATTSDYGFTLTQERFDSLRKGELDLQLKCFQHGDKKQLQQYNVWPTMPNRSTESSVKIFINNVAVPITSLDRSLYVGRLCVVGLNKLVVSVASCVCSHSFIMQLVSRRPIEAVINEIFMQSQRFIQSPIVARDKLLKIIETDGSQSRIPLYYANGNCTQRLRIPARSVRCSHSTCFDLEAFLMANQDNSYFDCPFAQCKSVFTLGEIEVDQFVAQILSETMRMPNAYEICLEANGCWRLIDPLPVIYPSTATSQQPRQQQPHPSSQPQCTTSSQNDFIQSNPSNTTNNNTASLPFTNTTNNEQQQIPTRSTAHKRERDENNSAAENHSLKRIKSESFAANVTSQQQSRSPYDPSSVPAPPSGSWIQSPSGALPSVLSPYGPSTSTSPQLAQTASQQQHQQRCGPPSAPSKYGGPGTPATPSNAQNPPSIGPAIGTSPGSTGNALQTSVQQQGSVEAVSVSGSAPYTPASVGSISGSAHLNNVSSSVTSTGTCENSATTATPQTTGSAATTNNCLNELSSSLNIGQIDDFFDDLIFSDAKMSSAAEMQKYLNEDFLAGSGLAEINAALKCESDVSRTITDAQDWNDVAQVIAEQS